MFRFLLKKTFFDGWDHFFGLFLLNVPFSFLLLLELFLGLSLLAAGQGPGTVLLQLSFLSLLSLPLGLHAGAVAWMAKEAAAGGKGLGWLEGLRRTWSKSVIAAPLSALALLAGSFGFLFYARNGGVLGWLLAGLLFWILLALLLVLIFLFPALARSEGSTSAASLKRLLLFILDNLPFSLALLGVNIISLPLSLLTGGLLPGLSWSILLSAEALQLRMRKYDWMEANPGADRRSPPWDELLAPDKELLGERSLRGFFFPWKDAK